MVNFRKTREIASHQPPKTQYICKRILIVLLVGFPESEKSTFVSFANLLPKELHSIHNADKIMMTGPKMRKECRQWITNR